MFHDSIELNMSIRDLDEEWAEVLEKTFQHLTEENLDVVEAYLESNGLEAGACMSCGFLSSELF